MDFTASRTFGLLTESRIESVAFLSPKVNYAVSACRLARLPRKLMKRRGPANYDSWPLRKSGQQRWVKRTGERLILLQVSRSCLQAPRITFPSHRPMSVCFS